MVRKLDLHEDAVFRHCNSAVEIMGFEYAESARPISVFAIAVSGWMNHRQLQVIEYLREENRVLREANSSMVVFMLTLLALRVISRIRCLNRSRAFGAMTHLTSEPAVKLNPRNFRSCGRATAVLVSFTLSLSSCVMNRVMLSITR
jgi:hypothetical protein